ncbi:DUF5713 family protein [Streptomyces aquilus]|uniref:DUF5713 family protein n=1 Tax=Streptomyces aquilus TaxID=2548456 RepID=UPI0036BF673F
MKPFGSGLGRGRWAIERAQPSDLQALYALTHAATEESNLLDRELVMAGSEIETVAREWICENSCFLSAAYGFTARTRRS